MPDVILLVQPAVAINLVTAIPTLAPIALENGNVRIGGTVNAAQLAFLQASFPAMTIQSGATGTLMQSPGVPVNAPSYGPRIFKRDGYAIVVDVVSQRRSLVEMYGSTQNMLMLQGPSSPLAAASHRITDIPNPFNTSPGSGSNTHRYGMSMQENLWYAFMRYFAWTLTGHNLSARVPFVIGGNWYGPSAASYRNPNVSAYMKYGIDFLGMTTHEEIVQNTPRVHRVSAACAFTDPDAMYRWLSIMNQIGTPGDENVMIYVIGPPMYTLDIPTHERTHLKKEHVFRHIPNGQPPWMPVHIPEDRYYNYCISPLSNDVVRLDARDASIIEIIARVLSAVTVVTAPINFAVNLAIRMIAAAIPQAAVYLRAANSVGKLVSTAVRLLQ